MPQLRLPSDNKIVDSEGRILPQWKSLFDKLSFVAALKSEQITILQRFLESATTPDANGSTFLDSEGNLNPTALSDTTQLDLIENGVVVSRQDSKNGPLEIGVSDELTINPETGLINFLPSRLLPPAGSGMIGAIGLSGAVSGSSGISINRAYAAPIRVESLFNVTSYGTIITSGTSVSGRATVHASTPNYRLPGRIIRDTGVVSYGSGSNDVMGVDSFSLEKGIYWIIVSLVGVSPATTPFVGGGQLGYILDGSDYRPIMGLFRSCAPADILADESGSSWTVATSLTTASFPAMFLEGSYV